MCNSYRTSNLSLKISANFLHKENDLHYFPGPKNKYNIRPSYNRLLIK